MLITNRTRSEHWVRVPFVSRLPPCALPEATRELCNAHVSLTLADPQDPHRVCPQQVQRDNMCFREEVTVKGRKAADGLAPLPELGRQAGPLPSDPRSHRSCELVTLDSQGRSGSVLVRINASSRFGPCDHWRLSLKSAVGKLETQEDPVLRPSPEAGEDLIPAPPQVD